MAAVNKKYLSYDANLVPRVHGLYNAGNTCWHNALTQLLFSLPAFNEFALRKGGSNEVKSSYLALYKRYLEQVLPKDVINKIRAEEGLKPYIAEQDVISPSSISTMLFRAFIEDLKLTNAINPHKRGTYQIGSQDSPATGLIDLLESFCCEEIYKHFNNRYEVATTCANPVCGKVSSRQYDKNPLIKIYFDLSFKTQKDLEFWLMYHKEKITDFSCENCKMKGGVAMRVETLRFLREVVLINWILPSSTRFYPETFMLPESAGNTLHYRRVGQIEWSGSYDAPSFPGELGGRGDNARNPSYSSSGHYWATVLRTSKPNEFSWYRVNDDSVTEMKEAERDRSVIVAYHMWSVTPTTDEERARFGI